MNDQPLVITPAQARYIADYLFEEFVRCENFSETSLDCFADEIDLDLLILNSVEAINGGAMEGFDS